ncbi:MAG: hypothetical protein AAF627_22185 [Myxococcota bacterium]
MPQCPHCAALYEDGVGNMCPSCGQDVLLPPSRPRAAGDAASVGGPPPLPPKKRRTISQAGPSAPAGVPTDDIAPNGWGTQPAAESWSGVTPPPLPPKNKRPTNGKPSGPPPPPAAKLLLQELKAQSPDVTGSIPAAPTVAQAKIDLPIKATKKRRVSDAFVIAILGLVVVSGIAYAVLSQSLPDVDMGQVEVQALRSKKQMAIRAMEEGHALVVQGESKAKDAVSAYQRALSLDPTLASAERGLGISFATLENAEEAIAHYERYLELAPEAPDRREVKKTIRRIRKQAR